jgi:TM2 domain-containing membrane protein YozV
VFKFKQKDMKLKLFIALIAMQLAFVANTNAAWITPSKAKTEQTTISTTPVIATAPAATANQEATAEKAEVTKSVSKSLSKDKWIAAVLAWLFGSLGVHNFYMGNTKKGLMQLGLSVLGIGAFIGGYILLVSSLISGASADFTAFDTFPTGALILMILGYVCIAAAGIWAVVDLIRILLDKIDVESGTAGGW